VVDGRYYLRVEMATVKSNTGRTSGKQSHLGNGGTLKKTYEISGPKIAKQTLETSIRMQKMTGYYGGVDPTSEAEKRLHTE
jgi:hypothetical protein